MTTKVIHKYEVGENVIFTTFLGLKPGKVTAVIPRITKFKTVIRYEIKDLTGEKWEREEKEIKKIKI